MRGKKEAEVVATKCSLPPTSSAPRRKMAGWEVERCHVMEQGERERGVRKKAGAGGRGLELELEVVERRREQTSRHCIASLLSRLFSSILQHASYLAALICALSRDSREVAALTKGTMAMVWMKMSSFIVDLPKLTVTLVLAIGILAMYYEIALGNVREISAAGKYPPPENIRRCLLSLLTVRVSTNQKKSSSTPLNNLGKVLPVPLLL